MNTAIRRTSQALAACCLAAASLSATAAGTVNVNFVDPDRYIDADRGMQRERNLDTLARHLQQLGQRELADGESLDIQVLDLDLAGRVDPFATRGAHDLRILNGGADWPRMELRYTLNRNGAPVRSGEEQLADLDYLGMQIPRFNNTQPLFYEKQMLDEWFEARFASHTVGSR